MPLWLLRPFPYSSSSLSLLLFCPVCPPPPVSAQAVGYCVRCAEVGCEACFHPMCAWLSGLSCEAESLRGLFLSFRGSVDRCFPRLVVKAYCYKHSPEFLADGRR